MHTANAALEHDLHFLLLLTRNYGLSCLALISVTGPSMTMEQVVLTNAIKSFTDHARKHAHRRAFVDKTCPTGADVESHRLAVNLICERMEALGQTPGSRFAEIELLRDKLGRHFPPHNIDYMNKIADAYQALGRVSAGGAKSVSAKAA